MSKPIVLNGEKINNSVAVDMYRAGLVEEATLDTSTGMHMYNTNKEMTVRIMDAIKKGTVITETAIDLQLLTMKRSRLSPLTDKVVDAFNNGSIVLLYNQTAKVPPALPFVCIKRGNKIIAFVFLNTYTRMTHDTDGNIRLDINWKELYALMETSYVAMKYNEYPSLLVRNVAIMKDCAAIYANMILRVLNKDFGLSTDRQAYDETSFIIARFFIENVWGATNPEVVERYSAVNILQPDRNALHVTFEEYSVAMQDKHEVRDLLAFLNQKFPRLSKLSIRFFIQSYMNYYTVNALYGIDVLPYFLFIVLSAMLGSYKLINQPILIDIIKNSSKVNSNQFYAELSKIL